MQKRERLDELGLRHLNNNLFCVVDVETTGLDPEEHEIWQVAIVPVNNRLEVSRIHTPFSIYISPFNKTNIDNLPANFKVNPKMITAFKQGHDPHLAQDLFEKWFESLRLPPGKKIVPIGHNYPFDRDFLIKWLTRGYYEEYFSAFYRDTMQIALFYNDRAAFQVERHPFPRVKLSNLASELKINYDEKSLHDALSDCRITLEVFKRLVFMNPV